MILTPEPTEFSSANSTSAILQFLHTHIYTHTQEQCVRLGAIMGGAVPDPKHNWR